MHRTAAFFRRCWQVNAPITVFGVATIVFTLAAIVGLVSDPRIIVGQPAWLKPVKFGLSIAMYSFSIIWLLGFVRAREPWVKKTLRAFTWIVIVVFTAEIIPITIQVLRGTRSHFNVATPFDQVCLLT